MVRIKCAPEKKIAGHGNLSGREGWLAPALSIDTLHRDESLEQTEILSGLDIKMPDQLIAIDRV